MTNRFNFRAYIKSLNKIYRVYNLMENGDKVEVIDDNGDFVGDGDGFYKNDFDLMQSTGFVDKNGKEIFEGNIIKYIYPDGEHIIKQIYYSKDNSQMYYANKNKSFYACFYEILPEEVEVIGNIYENKEFDEEED